MSVSNEAGGGAARAWVMAAAVALLVFLLLTTVGGWGLAGSLGGGAVVAAVLGPVLSRRRGGSGAAPGAKAGPAPARRATPQPAPEPAVAQPAPEPVAPTVAPVAEPAPLVRPTVALAGEEELASRKGTWIYSAETAGEAPVVTASDQGAAPEANTSRTPVAMDAGDAAVRPTRALAGEAELAARKGTWVYSPVT